MSNQPTAASAKGTQPTDRSAMAGGAANSSSSGRPATAARPATTATVSTSTAIEPTARTASSTSPSLVGTGATSTEMSSRPPSMSARRVVTVSVVGSTTARVEPAKTTRV